MFCSCCECVSVEVAKWVGVDPIWWTRLLAWWFDIMKYRIIVTLQIYEGRFMGLADMPALETLNYTVQAKFYQQHRTKDWP